MLLSFHHYVKYCDTKGSKKVEWEMQCFGFAY